MKIIQKIKIIMNRFWIFHRSIVWKNLIFKNIHKDQTCLIYGNGASLKYYNLTYIKDYISIGCTYSLTDKRLTSQKLTYCVISDSYLLYPFRLHNYTNKIAFNYVAPILKKIIKNNSETQFFTSITNYYSFFVNPSNLNYFHHFGEKRLISSNLAENFTNCAGALDIMIGIAKYMGFKKVVLLGCDYLGTPKMEGHFYSDSAPIYGKDDPVYSSRIKEIAGELNVIVILPNGVTCPTFEAQTFEKYFGFPEGYQSNTDIIDNDYLLMMRKANIKSQLWM